MYFSSSGINSFAGLKLHDLSFSYHSVHFLKASDLTLWKMYDTKLIKPKCGNYVEMRYAIQGISNLSYRNVENIKKTD